MKLFVQSLIIFFGTLMAAGFVALGEPGRSTNSAPLDPGTSDAVSQVVDAAAHLVDMASGGRSNR